MTCVIENEELAFAESETTVYLWLKTSNRFIPFADLEKCIWGDNTKFVFNIVNEPLKTKPTLKKTKITTPPFNTKVEYPEYKLTISEIKIPKSEPKPIEPPETSLNDLFIGGAASVALLMSVVQQVKKAKEEKERSNCCAKVIQIETELNKIQIESKQDNKALHAEIIEHYKEMKELRDDSLETKEIISKIIDRMRGDHVKERTED